MGDAVAWVMVTTFIVSSWIMSGVFLIEVIRIREAVERLAASQGDVPDDHAQQE